MKKIALGLLVILLNTPIQSAQSQAWSINLYPSDALFVLLSTASSFSLIKNGITAYCEGNKAETFGDTLYALGKKQSDPMSSVFGQLMKIVGANSKIQGALSVLMGSSILVWATAVAYDTIQERLQNSQLNNQQEFCCDDAEMYPEGDSEIA